MLFEVIWFALSQQYRKVKERKEEKRREEKKGRDNFLKYKIKREFFSVYFRVKYKTELENMQNIYRLVIIDQLINVAMASLVVSNLVTP